MAIRVDYRDGTYEEIDATNWEFCGDKLCIGNYPDRRTAHKSRLFSRKVKQEEILGEWETVAAITESDIVSVRSV